MIGQKSKYIINLKNYNPMSLFDNSVPMFETIESKQKEYTEAVSKVKTIQTELDIMWE